MSTPAKATISAISGAVLGFVLVAFTGILALQGEARRAGAVLDVFSSEVLGIVNPQPPFLAVIGSAALGALILCVLIVPRQSAIRSIGFLLAAGASVWVGVISGPHLGVVHDLTIGDTLPAGVAGWLRYGSVEPSVYLVALVVLGSVLLHVSRTRAEGTPEDASFE